MAEIIQDEGGGKKKGKKRAKKHSTHIDMTPMVDLVCLLLTFFMLTTAFSKPKVMEIILPDKEPIKNPPKVDDSRVINVILDENDRLFWYPGLANPQKLPLPTIAEADFSKDGIRKVLLGRNKDLFTTIYQFEDDLKTGKKVAVRDTIEKRISAMKKADKAGPIVLIKATEKVKYRNIVDIIDEMAITNIARYPIVDINDLEKQMLEDYKTQHPK